jgi:PAS domain-containing protein
MQQRNLVLILARDLADKLASAVFVVDADGRIVFFNERAEQIMGKTYADIGAMDLERLLDSFSPRDLEGGPLTPAELPISVALHERRPTHMAFRITRDEDEVDIGVTALPLFARSQEFVGAAAIFWVHEPDEAGSRSRPNGASGAGG